MKTYSLDPEIRAFLERGETFYTQDVDQLGVDGERDCYRALCEAFEAPLPPVVSFRDDSVAVGPTDIAIRRYTRENRDPAATILYFHGGGFILGNLESHHSLCADIVGRTGLELVAVDYRLAPEHVFPDQVDDALAAFLHEDRGRTLVAGDSAGAALAVAICVVQRSEQRRPIGQLLVYPGLGGHLQGLDSYREHRDAPGLTTAGVHRYYDLWSGGRQPASDPRFAPLELQDVSGMPPCIAVAADFDPLRDDAVTYTRKLKNAGIDARCLVEPGLVHGFLRARHCSRLAADSFARICDAFVEMAHYGDNDKREV